jgi:hypothetical protein
VACREGLQRAAVPWLLNNAPTLADTRSGPHHRRCVCRHKLTVLVRPYHWLCEVREPRDAERRERGGVGATVRKSAAWAGHAQMRATSA